MDGLSAAFALLLALTFSGSAVFAASGDDPDMQGYDAIVNQLNRENERSSVIHAKQTAVATPDALDAIWFHGGVGISTFMEDLNFADGSSLFIGQKGVTVSGGIDLFSNNWLAEVTMRNFGETEDSATHVALKEFDLKVVYHDKLPRNLGFHIGGGLSGRYMSIRRPGETTLDYTTPSSVLTGGIEYFFADRLSVGLEGGARTSLISDTIDRASYDATLRVDLQL
jgi:hypothetical protein